MLKHVTVRLDAWGDTIRATKQRTARVVARGLALFWHRFYWARYCLSIWKARHGLTAISAAIFLLMAMSAYFAPVLQTLLEPRLADQTRLANLHSLFLNVGSALIGAAAIAFSLVMFAMQINVERMPHGLFRKISADTRIMAAFVGTFLLAISVACASLIPEKSWVAVVTLACVWAIALILILFLYAYRRALLLINPIHQLNLLLEDATYAMRAWVRRAKRATPLFEETDSGHSDRSLRSTHDLPRLVYFQKNPHWTTRPQQAIQHAMSFARRYAEQGDHEVSSAALSAVVNINQGYIEAKGKTFFGDYPFVDNPLTTDGLINSTLEHLRQNIRVGISRGDEQQIDQTLRTMAALVQVYLRIDYSDPHASKTHVHLAAGYLSEAVKTVAPHNMGDVLMEGVRLMGQSAHFILTRSVPQDIVTLADDIRLIACLGAVNEKYRPVTLVAIEQLATLTFAVIRSESHDFGFALDKLRENVTSVARLFLNVPEPPLASPCSTFLGPYYSSTSTQSLLSRLTELVNAVAEAKADDEAAKTIIRNIEKWADGLYRTEKELLLLSIEKRSLFTFDVIHWIAHISRLLLAVSNAPACDEHTRDGLRKHALRLISSLSCIPDDKETVAHVEIYQVTETLFEVATDAYRRGCLEFATEVGGLLLDWAFKGGRHQTGRAILERSLYGLATLAVITENSQVIEDLKRKIAARLAQPDAPDQEIRDRTAREIRSRAATLYREGRWSSRIEHEMSRVDSDKLRPLLEEFANILSPETKGEAVRTDFY